jgi:cytoplasmic iron level regulating protein YaaA (DUF328/UPF0246 family)
VLLLLPPSEGKRAPAGGAPMDLEELVFAEALGKRRDVVLTALERVAKGPRKRALAALGLSPGQADEVERDVGLRTAPAAPAAEVYTGVLFQHLDLATLGRRARSRAEESVLVASALWGVVRVSDRIPAYRLSMGAKLPLPKGRGRGAAAAKGLAATWRPELARVLPDEEGELVVDARSAAYAAAWRPQRATLVEVRAVSPAGTVVSHMAKAARGDIARRLLEARAVARTPQDVVAAAGAGARLHEPAKPGGPWTVEVVHG